jgi:hypothetical protein
LLLLWLLFLDCEEDFSLSKNLKKLIEMNERNQSTRSFYHSTSLTMGSIWSWRWKCTSFSFSYSLSSITYKYTSSQFLILNCQLVNQKVIFWFLISDCYYVFFQYWSIASWWVGSNAVYSTLKQVNSGDRLFGTMGYNANQTWSITARGIILIHSFTTTQSHIHTHILTSKNLTFSFWFEEISFIFFEMIKCYWYI